MVQQVICQLHCIWKNTNSCEFMGAHARSSAHGCPWMFMVVHACVWVFMCFCLFVVLFCCHPLYWTYIKKMNVRWRSQPWADFFAELSAIQGFEGAFLEISSGRQTVKTGWPFFCQKQWSAKKWRKSWWGLVVFNFFAKTKRPIQPRLDQSLKGLQPSISENQNKN